VTTENMYVRTPGYGNASQQVPPIQTFVPGTYDYTVHPMSAPPFNPFGVDMNGNDLLTLVTTQV
jgi:hypothetical protein